MKKLYLILPLALILCFVVGCQDKEAMAELEAMRAQAAVEEQNKADLMKIAETFQETWNSHDLDGIANLYAEDAVYFVSDSPEPMRGRNAIKEGYKAYFEAMPDVKTEFKLILASRDYLICEGVTKGTHSEPFITPEGEIPATGRSIEIKFLCLLKVNSEGQIVEDRTYFDTAEFMRQLGLIE